MAASTAVEEKPLSTRKKIIRETAGAQRNRLLILNKLLCNVRENRTSARWHTFLIATTLIIALSMLVAELLGYDWGEGTSMAMTMISLAFLICGVFILLRMRLADLYDALVRDLGEELQNSPHREEDIAWLENAEPGTAYFIAILLDRFQKLPPSTRS